MITTERNIFIGGHLTAEQKESFRYEAERRDVSMSVLLAQIIDEWLVKAEQEEIEGSERSNRRRPGLQNVPLPFEE